VSPKFAEDLEHTIDWSGVSLADPSFIGNREDIPEEQDPLLKSSLIMKMLSVGGSVAGKDGGSPRFSVLWRSCKFVTENVSETGGDALREIPRLTDKTIPAPEE
jgi:hypothetical protein